MTFDLAKWRAPLLVGLVFMLILASKAPEIWAGFFPDNDDQMRLQQVRDLLAGQGWFNVGQRRFETPEGGAMHWSRIPDIFIAALIILSAPFLGQTGAELFALTAWPLMLLVVALAGIALSVRRLGGGQAGMAVAIGLFALSASNYNFWPGRIDHHGFEAALVAIAFAAVLSPGRSVRSGIIAALCIVAGLSVALEMLPAAAALIMAMGILWIVNGAAEGRRLVAFGLALAGFALAAFVLDAPGPFGRRAVCDAFGQGHLIGLMAGGGLLALLGLSGDRLTGWPGRLVAGGVAGGVAIAVFAGAAPACLGSPFADMDPVAVSGWLSRVGEARHLGTMIADDLPKVIADFGFMLGAIGAAAWSIRRAGPPARLNWWIAGLMLVITAGLMVWQIRATLFAHLFASIAAGAVLGGLIDTYLAKRGERAALALVLGVVLLTPISWKTLGSAFPANKALMEAPGSPKIACREASAYAAMTDLAPARMAAPIDLGTSILVRTPHTIFAGPYHRNPQGVRFSLDVFRSEPDASYALLLAADADYLVYCKGLPQTDAYAREAPDGLAARLNADALPDWLSPADGLTGTDNTVRLYHIRRPGD